MFNNALFCTVLDRTLVATCKDSIGWMFSKLDTNNDLYLDQAELAAINLDKYEVCIRPFFNSCDSYRDGKVSTAEWCLCFWRESKLHSYILSADLKFTRVFHDWFTITELQKELNFLKLILFEHCWVCLLSSWPEPDLYCVQNKKKMLSIHCFIAL